MKKTTIKNHIYIYSEQNEIRQWWKWEYEIGNLYNWRIDGEIEEIDGGIEEWMEEQWREEARTLVLWASKCAELGLGEEERDGRDIKGGRLVPVGGSNQD